MKLYIVATPIGNMEDITYRAVKVLSEVGAVAAEDTRHTGNLLGHYGIRKRLIPCHSYNEERSAEEILSLLDSGIDVAYCSDAGTPCVSDPGARLVEYIRGKSDHDIVPIPGASALTALVSVAGNMGKGFYFEGFLSVKAGRRKKRLEELVSAGSSFVIYESPFRVIKTLRDISEICDCKVVIGREMTKMHEEFITGRVSKVIDELGKRESVKGEFAILVIPEGSNDNDSETQNT